MKKILPLLICTFLSSQAQVIDAIAIDVEGEPITMLEIKAVQEKMQMSKQAAVETLIKDRLQKVAIQKANIQISDAQVEAKANTIASSKGITQAKMQSLLAQKGLSWENYLKQLKMEMKKEVFFKQVILSSISRPSDTELKEYYKAHQSAFANAPKQMSLIMYKSQSASSLQQAILNPIKPTMGVQKENILAASNELSPELLKLINNTAEKSFTKPINTGKGFIAYFVNSKGSSQGGFMSVKNAVEAHWLQEQQAKAGKDFLNKLKSNAKIRVIHL